MTYTTLVDAGQLNQIINAENTRVIDCRFNLIKPVLGFQLFQQSHIPTSQYADLNQQLAGPILTCTGRHPLPNKEAFEKQLCTWGIDKDSQIIVYDDACGAIASRLWWMCQWAGLENVAVLDGGFNAWLELNLDVTQELTHFNKTNFSANYDDNLWVSTEVIETSISQTNTQLIDARSHKRYVGEQEPIDSVAGHIPSAINIPFEQNLDDHGYFLSKKKLYKLHQSQDEQLIISMCGSGVTACHNLLARKYAGLTMGKLYVGSWSEWITNPTRPIKNTNHS